ncbi:acyl-phosphate glycerol 3-phosphate acyltransferase [Prauserella marina]|uniref:1-acyl-sn-glycerol-3-phosphate acyltransferase n=1 Tax=Prauserella marina TaxID=530584 RepID=A0A222VNR5_9PSEU|nr:lysophospholipid acyltransferase family protein [Prauserella marina]ASR35393.1 acyl-phosphate glycerol 3-phosphate acyltransferase [Prauserella marina]PWV84807.1 1-acyl-sn-glycerol-3-phosphate acyltransferase [Prauserella marina]SDC12651.1 1-acyl-sn-glycerol-3-phosphate acyltransferase [Prauserella marina]
MLYRLMKYVLLGPLLRLLWPAKVTGRENIPETGGAILAGNHLAVADSFFMPLRVPRKVTFPAKQEYFTEKGPKGLLKKWFFTGVGQFPIDRSSGSAAQAALDTAIRLVRSGHLLGIYPEGTRSPDGRLYKGKTGVARIALESRAPVIPVVMVGTDKVNPIGSKMWRPRKLEIRFGRPLDFSRYEGLAGDRFIERSITDEIMYALMELSGQEYVDIYAAKAKELIAADEAGVRPAVPLQPEGREPARLPESKAG